MKNKILVTDRCGLTMRIHRVVIPFSNPKDNHSVSTGKLTALFWVDLTLDGRK